jgi:hypothetical protein
MDAHLEFFEASFLLFFVGHVACLSKWFIERAGSAVTSFGFRAPLGAQRHDFPIDPLAAPAMHPDFVAENLEGHPTIAAHYRRGLNVSAVGPARALLFHKGSRRSSSD